VVLFLLEFELDKLVVLLVSLETMLLAVLGVFSLEPEVPQEINIKEQAIKLILRIICLFFITFLHIIMFQNMNNIAKRYIFVK
jgi:glucan phosphoethanolaminetransferase (alkaline phosphatase superfamily)